ncbi:BCCT family transporter [Cerasicoccus frondis]|uniref:BCCT family transporter n=1 Tax=Cerasicoccus frondis TaxID=490090 RepID=UPI0028529C54|nr:BCCT family transporter [Cerasicoccus frondis]
MSNTQDDSDSAPDSNKRIDIHAPVFFCSAGLIIFFVVISLISLETAGHIYSAIQSWIAHNTRWFFIAVVDLFLLFVIGLIFSRFAHIRLGGKDAKPEFSYFSWISMLFSAGMGIGLLFYSVAEPIMHASNPPFHGVDPLTEEAAIDAMQLTYFHWGFHAWGIYALVGLALAYFSFNHGAPLTIRSAFRPLLGDRVDGPIGNSIDILAVVATLFGVATSLGLGVQQVNAGFAYLFGVSESSTVQVLLIAGITALATMSVISGLDGGIRRLSELNLSAAGLLLIFILIAGPTLFLLGGFVQNLGAYAQNFLRLSTWTETYQRTEWQEGWTVFYWAWWIAWSPFVGMFIARISRGRTIREFLVGVLLAPTLMTFAWLSIFGNAALFEQLYGAGELAAEVNKSIPVALFEMLEAYPLAKVASLLSVVVVITFFVTSSDSGSLVIDIITAGGNTDPPVAQRIFWAVLEGVVAAVLLIGGGLGALQTASITTGLPFAIVLVAMMFSLYRGLSRDPNAPPSYQELRRRVQKLERDS